MDSVELRSRDDHVPRRRPRRERSPAVVFVHGLLVDNQLWTATADVLAQRGIRSYAPNWPTGSHPIPMAPDADLSPRGHRSDRHRFLTALDLNNVTLVGNDTGGAICQYVIDTDHSRVGGLSLRTAMRSTSSRRGVRRTDHDRQSDALIKPMLTALPTAARHARCLWRQFAGSPDPTITRSWIEPGLSEQGVRRDAAKLISTIDAKDLLDVSTRFGAFTKPVRSPGATPTPSSRLAALVAAFPNATLTPVPADVRSSRWSSPTRSPPRSLVPHEPMSPVV